MTSRIDIIGQNGGTAEHYDMKKYAVASEGCSHYLTPGKPYEIIEDFCNDLFNITDDEGDVITCAREDCCHNNGDWQILNEDTIKALDKLSQIGQEMQPEDYLLNDMVKKPSHYMLLPEYEVKDIIKAWADKVEDSDMEMTVYQSGYVVQALQYLLRCYAKGQWQDIEKAIETLQFAVDSRLK